MKSTARLLVISLLLTFASSLASAQIFKVLYAFSGGADGAFPPEGVILGRDANLYGTTAKGGRFGIVCGDHNADGCGTVFELARNQAGWTLNTLYAFTGGVDSLYPNSRVVFGPDGGLYGTTAQGEANPVTYDYGSVYELLPPSMRCTSTSCFWTHRLLHRFLEEEGGRIPTGGDLTFDVAGNVYGATELGGVAGVLDCTGTSHDGDGCGAVYEVSPAGNGWSEKVIYAFDGGPGGYEPDSGVVFGADGNLYGETVYAGCYECYGLVYRLAPSGSGWSEQVIYTFTYGGSGGAIYPGGGLTFDSAGNIYGGTCCLGGGSVFELMQSKANWTLSLLYARFQGNDGPTAAPVMDSAGNLYGTTNADGRYAEGSVYKLTRTPTGWTYTDLHDFHQTDGEYPQGPVMLDSMGNIYGTTTLGGGGSGCGGIGCGVVWEITPD